MQVGIVRAQAEGLVHALTARKAGGGGDRNSLASIETWSGRCAALRPHTVRNTQKQREKNTCQVLDSLKLLMYKGERLHIFSIVTMQYKSASVGKYIPSYGIIHC